MSDIHGYYNVLIETLKKLQYKEILQNNTGKFIFLGDYIDRGINSYKVVEFLYKLQQEYGTDKVIVLRGNHEEYFLEFLSGKNDQWLNDDQMFLTTTSFMRLDAFEEIRTVSKKKGFDVVCSHLRSKIIDQCKEVIQWLNHLPYYYETENQIFVHAGIDEEVGETWKLDTELKCYTHKYPATTGPFYKDIIAGHVSTAEVAQNEAYLGEVYYDGYNHYYIDGTVYQSGIIPVLIYDTESKTYSY